MQEEDPLFEVLRENQVGVDPISGSDRISTEVLDEMRRYLITGPAEERHIREERVKVLVIDVSKDLVAVRSFLRLEKPPSLTTELKLGKGPVFGYDLQEAINANTNRRSSSAEEEELFQDTHPCYWALGWKQEITLRLQTIILPLPVQRLQG